MDKIFLNELKVDTIIGIFEWERNILQTVIIDLEMSADIAKAAASDEVIDALNYKSVAKRVQGFVEKSSFQLVETLAEHIASIILDEFSSFKFLAKDIFFNRGILFISKYGLYFFLI